MKYKSIKEENIFIEYLHYGCNVNMVVRNLLYHGICSPFLRKRVPDWQDIDLVPKIIDAQKIIAS